MHTYIHIHTYVHTCIHKGLEISGIASPNANHFWDNCESVWQSDSPNFFGISNYF